VLVLKLGSHFEIRYGMFWWNKSRWIVVGRERDVKVLELCVVLCCVVDVMEDDGGER